MCAKSHVFSILKFLPWLKITEHVEYDDNDDDDERTDINRNVA